jgi:hypothetical protein
MLKKSLSNHFAPKQKKESIIVFNKTWTVVDFAVIKKTRAFVIMAAVSTSKGTGVQKYFYDSLSGKLNTIFTIKSWQP